MKNLKKWIALSAAAAMLLMPTTKAEAASYDYACGQCYNECRTMPKLAPAIVLGAVIVAAVVAVAIQNSDNAH